MEKSVCLGLANQPQITADQPRWQSCHRRDDRLVYSLQAIGRRDYENELQSQRNVWRGYMYCVITALRYC